MPKKTNISADTLLPWDEYKAKTPNEALPAIYARVEAVSKKSRSWYWTSIDTKRWTSLTVRFLAFGLLILGTSLPILAGMQDKIDIRLNYTQLAVVFLAVAGLLQVADKVFGWSSGWMRYVSTVTAMESLARNFELEWAKYLIEKSAEPDVQDMQALFEMAKLFEQETLRLQAEETGKWVSEFNAGISLLDSMIKTQKEEADRKSDAIRNEGVAKHAAERVEAMTKLAGAIELNFVYEGELQAFQVTLDENSAEKTSSRAWLARNVMPGIHAIEVRTLSEPPVVIHKLVEVAAGTVLRQDIVIAPQR